MKASASAPVVVSSGAEFIDFDAGLSDVVQVSGGWEAGGLDQSPHQGRSVFADLDESHLCFIHEALAHAMAQEFKHAVVIAGVIEQA